MFEDRVEELESLKRLVKLLKNFVKRYKQAIVKMQLADIDRTEKLVKEKRRLQRDYEKYEKEEHGKRLEEISAELVILKGRSIDLNVKHFVNLSDEYLVNLQAASNSPNTKIRPVFSKSQVDKWNVIIGLIPKDNHTYIQKSFS